jgi:hypothetical protein
MTVTMEEVRAVLDPDEPRYSEASRLGPDALPHLAALTDGPETGLAAKAAYLASMIDAPEANDVVQLAAESGDSRLRAAAAAVRNLSAQGQESIASRLLEDEDVAVRKTTLSSLSETDRGVGSSVLLERVNRLASRESEPRLRQLAAETAQHLRRD